MPTSLSTSELVALIVSAISGTFSLMLALIVWLVKHAANTERTLLNKAIDEAKAEAKRASDLLNNEIELRHLQDVKMAEHEGRFREMKSDVKRLEVRDDAQQEQLLNIKERLDRGARTVSAQAPAARMPREEPTSDPPAPTPPPMRPRFPSRRGE